MKPFKQLEKKRWSLALSRLIRLVGMLLFIGNTLFFADWRFSIMWALMFPVIAMSASWLVVILKVPSRIPQLNGYLLEDSRQSVRTQKSDEWFEKVSSLERNITATALAYIPAEDALICVPLLLLGNGATTALIAGMTFGALHLLQFSYLECLTKGIYYVFVCLLLLPHGLLTVVAGHLLLDISGWMILKVVKSKLVENSK